MVKFWSNIGLIFQIAIVIGLVLLFSFLDPFGLFKSKKLNLENTPVSVSSVKEIGKLISAEYYGEVLTSLQEAIIAEKEQETIDESKEFENIKVLYADAIRDFYGRKESIKLGILNRGNKLYDLFYREYPTVTETPFYQVFINTLLQDNEIGEKNEKKLLRKIFKKNENELTQFLESVEQLSDQTFKDERKKELEVLTADKKFRKSQIVVLGRGWVKAGIDFGQFTEKNFRYDEERKIIHLIGLKPQIITSTINPWFIPEKQVKGFEVVLMTRKAKKPEYMLKVKQRSLDKLRQKAFRAGIISQARKNAERNLKNFFSLLIPDGINEVIIHDDFSSYLDDSFISEKITPDVMQSIDSLMIFRFKEDSSATYQLKNELKSKKVYLRNENSYTIQRYSSYLSMIEDELLTSGELYWLKIEKENLENTLSDLTGNLKIISDIYNLPDRLDSVWHFPPKEVLKEYQEEIDKVLFKEFKWYQILSDHKDYLNHEKEKQKALERKVLTYMISKRFFSYEELASIIKENTKNVVKGDVTYSVSPDSSIVEIEKEGHKIKMIPSIDSQLTDLEGSISELTEKDIKLVNIQELEYANKKVALHWENDKASVAELINDMKNNWQLATKDTLLKINRYSTWNKFLNQDTLNTNFLTVLQKLKRSFDEADKILSENKMRKWNFVKVKRLNNSLDNVWFYPSKEKLEDFEEKADDKNYLVLTKGQREKRKTIYLEMLIQDHILLQRKKESKKALEQLINKVTIIKSDENTYTNDSDKFKLMMNFFNSLLKAETKPNI